QYPLASAWVYIVPGSGNRATRHCRPPIPRARSPVARDRPWPTRQPTSGSIRGLLAALVLSWVEFLLSCGTAITVCVTIGVFSLPALVRPCYNSVKSHDGRNRKSSQPAV